MRNIIKRSLRKLKIEQKLFWPVAAGAVLIIALFVFLISWYTGKIVEKESIKQGEMISVLITKKIVEEYSRVAIDTEKLADAVEPEYDNRIRLHEIATDFLNHQPDADGLTIEMKVKTASGEKESWLYAYKQFGHVLFSESKQQLKPSDYYFSPVSGWNPHYLESRDADNARQDVETYTALIDRKTGATEVEGCVCVSTPVDWNRNITIKYLADIGSHGFYLSKSGAVFHVTPPELRDKYSCDFEEAFEKSVKTDESFQRNVEKMKHGEDSIALVNDPVDGKPVWMSYSPLFDGWSFAVFLSDSDLRKQIWMIIINIIIIGALVFSLLLAWIKYIAKSIARPVKELDAASREIASGNFNAVIPMYDGNDEISRLSSTLRQMVGTINEHVEKEKSDAIAKERVNSQLRVAAEIQMNLLPSDYSQIKKMDKVDIFAYLKPAWEVGGDLYNFINIDDRNIFFMIGDVADKGVPAAIYMTRTYSFLKVFKEELYKPGEVLTRLNSLLVEGNNSCMFATAFCAVLDTQTGLLRFANAGHVPPAILTAGGQSYYLRPKKNCPIGFMAARQYEEDCIQLESGDAIFMYTDGVNEARNNKRQLLGHERLLKMLEQCGHQECRQVLLDIQQYIDDFADGCEQSDDIAMLMLRYL